MNIRLLISLAALFLSACGGGGSSTASTPITISNLQYSPATANATLGTISIGGNLDFNSGTDLVSLRITDSNGTDSTVPISAPGLRSGRITVPATPIPGNPVGFYKFSIWLRDAAGIESNKLNGQVEIKRVPPKAIAGPDAVIYTNAPLTLDGSASTNVNGTPTTYAWRINPAFASATLSSLSAATTVFSCNVAGVFDVELRISDGADQTAPDSLVVSCIGSNKFTLGSSETDVSRLAGTPMNVSNIQILDYYRWEYADSLTYVEFSKLTKKVIAWRSYDIQLPVSLPFRDTNSTTTKIAIGSTKDEVARIQGTPLAVAHTGILDYDEWAYDKIGLTYIRFSKTTGLVTEYKNFDGSLKI